MLSIRAKSMFTHLFRGLVVLLLLSSIEALPTKPKHSPAAHSCPIRAPKTRLHKRSPLVHPSGKTPMSLFHGTAKGEVEAKSMASKVQLSKTHPCGDLHHNRGPQRENEGGAYFTDSVIAAAQYACYGKTFENPKIPATVHVLEFFWTPGSHSVYEFPTVASINNQQCVAHDMVTAPMHDPKFDKDLTPSFWQYAIVKQAALSGLAYHHTYEVHCKNVPKGAALTTELYQHGQGGNPNFHALTTQLSLATC